VDFLPGDFLSLSQETSNDSAARMNLGFLWNAGKAQRLSVGGVFRQGARFVKKGELLTRTGQLTVESLPLRDTLTLPHIYGIGISYSTAEGKTKVALDYDRVRYSQRLAELTAPEQRKDFRLPDSHEVHLGMERVMMTRGDLIGTLRLGSWIETAHDLEYR